VSEHSTQSTQTDRIMAVFLAVIYLAGLVYFLTDDGVPDRIVAYYTGAGLLIMLPTIIFLLSHVLTFSGMKNTLETISQRAEKIEAQTNGQLASKLDSQTDVIVSRISAEVLAQLDPGKRYDNG